MSQYPPQDPNYPYPGGQPGPYGAPDPYGQPQQPPQQPQSPYSPYGGYGQQPAYSGYPQTPQPQYPSTPVQPPYPDYGMPGQPSQYGAQAPQSPYGYPQGIPPAPAPSSNRRTITGIGIAAAVIVLVVVGVFVLRSLNSESVAGQWYGVGTFNITSPSALTFNAEIFMDLQQNGSSVSGSGKLCVNGGSGQTTNLPFTVSGSTTSSGANLQWGGTSNGSTFDTSNLPVHTTISGGEMTLRASDSSGSFFAGLRKGTEGQFTSDCLKLSPPAAG